MGFLDDDAWLKLVDAFNAAAVSGSDWQGPLEMLAAATGSRCAQLVGFGSDMTPFNLISGLDDDTVQALTELGGADPRFNPRIETGMRLGALRTMTDADVAAPGERRRHPFYADLLPRFELPHICAMMLEQAPARNVGIALLRTGREGEASDQQRRYFASLGVHLRSAARNWLQLGDQASSIIAGALDAVSMAAFICDRHGSVKALTSQADELVRQSGGLRLDRGRLSVSCRKSSKLMREVIERAATCAQAPSVGAAGDLLARRVVIEQPNASLLLIDVLPLARQAHGFAFDPRVLVIVRNARQGRRQIPPIVLSSAFGLTRAEIEVALSFAEGSSLDDIARQRARSVETVRVQMRSIFRKLGVRRQSELVALLNQLR
jgi:DNA-binding CsgD family transcriptional regulator